MIGLLCFVLAAVASPFKSKMRLEAENAVLRHQLIVLKRRLHGCVGLTNHVAGSLSSSIAGFRQSCRFSQLSGPRPFNFSVWTCGTPPNVTGCVQSVAPQAAAN